MTLEQRALLHPLNVRATRALPFRDVELRASSTGSIDFRGYACMTEQPYEMADMFGPYTEIVRAGAFQETLAMAADVGLVINHEGMHLARTKSGTLTLTEDGEGLLAEAPSLDPANPLVQMVRSAMDRGDMDEMSMAFRVVRQQWSPDYEQRDILAVNLHKGDVSLVNYGANPFTVAGLRSAPEARAVVAAITELRAGVDLSDETTATLRAVLDMCAPGDNIDDAFAQIVARSRPNPADAPEGPADASEAEAAAANVLALYKAKARLVGVAV